MLISLNFRKVLTVLDACFLPSREFPVVTGYILLVLCMTLMMPKCLEFKGKLNGEQGEGKGENPSLLP